MAITCVSVIMTVIVLNFFYRGPTLTHVPVWAQRYAIHSIRFDQNLKILLMCLNDTITKKLKSRV